MFGFTTTSPQCFGTVPDAPEVGRLGGDVRWVDVTSVVVSVVCDGTGDAEIGVWRVAWGRRCGCGWMDQISMTESDVRWQIDSSASLSRLTYSESGWLA